MTTTTMTSTMMMVMIMMMMIMKTMVMTKRASIIQDLQGALLCIVVFFFNEHPWLNKLGPSENFLNRRCVGRQIEDACM